MTTLTKDGVDVTTTVPRELVTLRSQGFREKPSAEEQLATLKVEDLRKELADRNLPVSGRKPDLVTRLAEQQAAIASTSSPAASGAATPPAE